MARYGVFKRCLDPVFLSAEPTAAPIVTESTGLGSMVLQLVLVLSVFAAVMYAVYFINKYVFGKRGKAFGFGKNKHMRVVEITSVGPGSTIHMVKVSEEYFLIGVTKTQVSFLTKLDSPPVSDDFDTSQPQPAAFDKFLLKLTQKRDNVSGHTGNKEHDNNDITG